MAEQNMRIEQFRKMATDDPNNELGHFSLGRALLDGGQHAEAIGAFDRVIELNKNISKVYQLKATALLALGRKDEAIETLKTGARIASERGDLMPKNDMLRTLKEMGIEMPELQAKAGAAPEVGEGQIVCHRCSQVKPKMAHAPFSNAQGKLIQEKICPDCWREWIGMGTKVINELRLPLSDPQAQKVFEQHMLEFLNLQQRFDRVSIAATVLQASVELLFMAASLICVPIAIFWLWKRRRIARGLLCWNCGADLSDKQLHIDFKGQSRCPKCGQDMNEV